MNLKELIAEFRSHADDLEEPFKWGDEELGRYFTDAEDQACRRALLLDDDETPTVCKLTVTAGVSRYALNRLIIRVDRAYLNTAKVLLDPIDEMQLDRERCDWRTATGVPNCFVVRRKKIQLIPEPVTADTLTLKVKRRPLKVLKDESDTPEIPEQYHLQLLDWVLHRAYMKHDADVFDEDFAKLHADKFTASFGPLPGADVDQARNLRRSPPTVKYGGL